MARIKQTFRKTQDSAPNKSTPKSDDDKTINYFKEEVDEDIPAFQPIVSKTQIINKSDDSDPIPIEDSFTEEEEDENWDVERVVGKRFNRRRGRNEYLIKWLGFDESDNSWERKSLLMTTCLSVKSLFY